MFRGLDDPDEAQAAEGCCACCVGGDQMADVGHLVRYAYTAGEEEDGAVGGEGGVGAVRAGDEGGEG